MPLPSKVTTGATVIGAAGLQPSLAEVYGHLCQLASIPITEVQANAWAAVTLAIVGVIMHSIANAPQPIALAAEAPADPPAPEAPADPSPPATK